MSMSSPVSVRDVLKGALASHRAGERAAAEAGYRAVLEVEPDHAEASHNLGVLMVQAGRTDEGLARLKAALKSRGGEPLHWFSLARGLLAAGDAGMATAVLAQARRLGLADNRFEPVETQARAAPGDLLVADRDQAWLLDVAGGVLLAQGQAEEAIGSFRAALAADPDLADAHHHLGSVLSETGRVAEGFAHFMRRATLVGDGMTAPGAAEAEHKMRHDRAQRDYLAREAGWTAGFHLADGERVPGSAVDPAGATPELLAAWRSSAPQMVVVDGFLTTPALERLRAYCAGSTVWRKVYEAGYLGAAPEDGFACPLLAQIVEEMQALYRPILDGEPFRYLGAFKYDSEACAGTNTHGDNSIVNVNLYIAPDEANLDPERGGMVVWDRAAADIGELRRLNGDEAAVRQLLASEGAQATVVPHRANRAVIFRSTLFHRTDAFRFRSDYLSRRINVSFLFGRFG
jgi:Flp pilus assembly protein TadD